MGTGEGCGFWLTGEPDERDAAAAILCDVEALSLGSLLLRLEQLVPVPRKLGFQQSNVVSDHIGQTGQPLFKLEDWSEPDSSQEADLGAAHSEVGKRSTHSVALFFCVLLISFSISAIFSEIPILACCAQAGGKGERSGAGQRLARGAGVGEGRVWTGGRGGQGGTELKLVEVWVWITLRRAGWLRLLV